MGLTWCPAREHSGLLGALLDIFLLEEAGQVGALEVEQFGRFGLVWLLRRLFGSLNLGRLDQ